MCCRSRKASSAAAAPRSRSSGGASARGGSQWDGLTLDDGLDAAGNRYVTVGNGSRWETFRGYDLTSQQANGSTLTASPDGFVHRSADGTVTSYFPLNQNCVASANRTCRWAPSSVVQPDGRSISLYWETWTLCRRPQSIDDEETCIVDSVRLGGVGNSEGYAIGFGYAAGGDTGRTPAPADWFRRTGASFANGAAAQFGVVYAYPAATVTEVTDPAGRVWRFTGTGVGDEVAGIRRPGAGEDTTTVARSGGVVTSVVRDGVTTGYARSVSGSTATMVVTDAAGKQTQVVSDLALGRPTAVTDPTGRTTRFAYDGFGRLVRTTAPEGNYTALTLDARGNAVQVQAVGKPGSGAPTLTTSTVYDTACANPVTCNSPLSSTDARGSVTDYAWDPDHGGLVSVTRPAGANGVRPQTRYGYAQVQNATTGQTSFEIDSVSTCRTGASCAGTADETRTSIAYETGNSLPVSVTVAAGDGSVSATAAVGYDAVGNIVSVDGPLPGADDTTAYLYDVLRRPTGLVGPDPDGGGPRRRQAIRTTYDLQGRAVSREAGSSDAGLANFTPAQTVTSTYDAADRLVRTATSAAGTTHAVVDYAYDAVGRVTCAAQRMDPAQWTGQGDACTPQTGGPNGPDRIQRTAYDDAGRPVSLTTAYGTADAATEQRAYSPNGQLSAAIDGEGNRTSYGFDGHDRPTATQYPVAAKGANASNGGDYEQLTYDANGNVTSRRLRDGQVLSYSYDALNRRVHDDNPNTNVAEVDVSYTYDLVGNLLNATDQNGWQTGFDHDALGRRTRQYSNLSSNALQYDVAGRLTRQTWADGFFVTYQYDIAGNVTWIRENGDLALAKFAYDDLGRRTSLARGDGTISGYAYDPAGRLSELTLYASGGIQVEQRYTYGYNPAGQIVTRTASNDAYAFTGAYNVDRPYAANGLNQYTLSGPVAPSYDARGNLTAAGGQSYGYNTRNQLFQTGTPGQLFYRGPNGLLVQIMAGGATTNLNYVGTDLVTEFDGATSGVARRYVFGPGTDEPLVWYEGAAAGDRRYLHADERGSIVAVTNDAGTVTVINTYDEYGIPGSANQGRFQYTGQKWIAELGLYDYKARMYSPTLGRFLQTDPIGYADGMNWYDYVSGDPVNNVDPWGLMRKCVTTEVLDDNGIVTAKFVNCSDAEGGGSSIFSFLAPLFKPFGGNGRGSGGLSSEGSDGSPQNDKKSVCASRLQKVAEGLQVGGDALAYPGIALAAVGAAAVGPVGAGPGFAIAEIGGTAGAIGQALEDYIHGRPRREIAARGFVGVAGGRVAVAGLRALTGVGSKIVGEFFDKALGEVGKRAVPWIDPDRCSK